MGNDVSQMETVSQYLNVALIGDSVLDNFYWLDKQSEDVRFQLEKVILDHTNIVGLTVYNFAVDESEVKDIVNGKQPAAPYSSRRKQLGFPAYPTQNDGKVYPLQLLEKHGPIGYGVLSVGGNDARVIIPKLLSNPMDVVKTFEESNFQKNLNIAVQEVQKRVSNLILVFVYIPHSSFVLSPMVVGNLMKKIFPYYLNIANKKQIPLINLSLTFNPFNRQHYGSTSIEPSNKSGMFIAQMIYNAIEIYEKTPKLENGVVIYGDGKGDQIFTQNANQFNYDKKLDEFLAKYNQNDSK